MLYDPLRYGVLSSDDPYSFPWFRHGIMALSQSFSSMRIISEQTLRIKSFEVIFPVLLSSLTGFAR
jgi:hypothetical protein